MLRDGGRQFESAPCAHIMRIALSMLVLTIWLGFYVLKDVQREVRSLEIQSATLREALKEERRINAHNIKVACNPEDGGDVVYMECGESFVPPYATCFCTVGCLADYTAVYTNSPPETCPLARENRG